MYTVYEFSETTKNRFRKPLNELSINLESEENNKISGILRVACTSWYITE